MLYVSNVVSKPSITERIVSLISLPPGNSFFLLHVLSVYMQVVKSAVK